MNLLHDELHEKFQNYLKRQISLKELETWMLPRHREYLRNVESPVGRLAVVIMHTIISVKEELITVRTAKRDLRRWWERRLLDSASMWATETSTTNNYIIPASLPWWGR